jgi:cytochrome c553
MEEIQVRTWPAHVTWIFATLFWASTAYHPGRAQQGEDQAPNIEHGKSVVVGAPGLQPGQACMNCHGVDGKGDFAAGFPRLAGQSRDYLLSALQQYASGMRDNQIMSPLASSLSEEQMRDVTAYYASLTDTPWQPGQAGKPEVMQYGAALSSIGSAPLGIQGCINCHGPAGQGLPPNYPALAGQPAAFLTSRLKALKAMPLTGDASLPQVMAHIASRMDNREIEALSQYFASIKPAPVQVQASAQAQSSTTRQPATKPEPSQ